MRRVTRGLIGVVAALTCAAALACAATAEMKKTNLEINPVPGQEVEALIHRLFATPPSVVERAKQILPVEK